MIRRTLALPLLLLAAMTMSAQSTVPTDLEIGFRWIDIEGNENMYRTQINEDEGLLLRSLRVSTVDFGGATFLDHFRVDASDLGAGPAGAFRVEAGKKDKWRLNAAYRQADAFTSIPNFALGQHTLDRERKMFDVDLELLPGGKFSPFIGYTSSTYKGPGTSTYFLGQDEFLLDSDLDESESEIRGGLAFNVGKFYGSVLQGWRDLDSDESLTLHPGANNGNNPNPILGHPVNAGGITRRSQFEVSTPFTNAFVAGQVTSRIRVIGNYSRFSADGEGDEVESATGSFVSFPRSIFFSGFDEDVSARSENRTWRGGLRAEVAIADDIDAFAGWRTENRDMDGAAAFHTIFRDTTNFLGADPHDALEEVFDAESALEREQNVLEAGIAARALGPFSFRVSISKTDQDVTLSPDLEEIVVVGPEQMGSYDREIDTIEASGAYREGNLALGLALRRDRADGLVMRTDYLDRDRIRARASYGFFSNRLRLGAIGEQTESKNDLGFDADYRQYGADFELALIEMFRLRGSYTRFDTDATALILRPETLITEESLFTEDGEALEAGISFLFKQISVDADFSTFDNEGSNPFEINRYRFRVVWDFLSRAGLAAEWSKDDYDEALFPITNFNAKRYGVFLRWRQ